MTLRMATYRVRLRCKGGEGLPILFVLNDGRLVNLQPDDTVSR